MMHNVRMWWGMGMSDQDKDAIKNHNTIGCENDTNWKACDNNSDWEDWMWMIWWETSNTEDTSPTSTKWLPFAKLSKIVELKDGDTYTMVASIVKQEVWNRVIRKLAYNWMIPWPLLKVKKGSKIKIKLINYLNVNTTLHSHWIRIADSKFDGLPTTMWGQQKPMKPWESFTYEINFPYIWVFWYHPHIREDYTQQMGLYWNYAVTESWYWSKVDKEEYMILDDFSTNDPFYKDKVNKTLMWRFWNIMLINDIAEHLQSGMMMTFRVEK